jgi:hypothetical protein
MSRRVLLSLILLTALVSACSAPVRDKPQSSPFDLVEAFVEANFERTDLKPRLAAYYGEVLVPCGATARPAPCSLEDWEVQFRSAYTVLFYTGHTGLAEMLDA